MSITLREGSITGLIGPNGAGKSTLFHLLSGVIVPDAGHVELFGVDVTALPPHERARRGLVRSFQLAREFGALTVLENLLLAPQAQCGERLLPLFFRPARVTAEERQVYARAREVLDLARLTPLRNEYAVNLSGGQKKLLELGRALMTGCPVILLDEPGAGVNPALMGLLTDMIRRLNSEFRKTFLIIEHDMDLVARLCDPVIVMTDGRHLAEGSFETVRKDPEVIRAYLGGGAVADV
ncbi:MAG: ABC transporter ATP-binding protein [Burkholderiales bacterium]|nr:ABC transporter ATP-binding protein [Burkholderiales bacterium]